jgi:hypothetical protein
MSLKGNMSLHAALDNQVARTRQIPTNLDTIANETSCISHSCPPSLSLCAVILIHVDVSFVFGSVSKDDARGSNIAGDISANMYLEFVGGRHVSYNCAANADVPRGYLRLDNSSLLDKEIGRRFNPALNFALYGDVLLAPEFAIDHDG